MAVDSQPKRKTSLEELLTLNVCVLFSKPLRTSFHVHRVSSRCETRGTSSLPLEQKYQQQCDCRIVESWSELGWSWIGLLPWSTIEQHTHIHTHIDTHRHPVWMGRNIDSQVSDQYQEDRPWLESDQRRKTKCFPLRGVDKPKSCRRWSPVRVVFTRTTSIFQPAIRNNLGIRFERERERRARFSTLERWVVPFERWSKDRSILDKRVYKNSSLEIASIVWHQGTNHLWRCGAAGITSSSWKPARDTGTCAPADLFWISSVRGRSVILDWEIRSKSSMIRDFCSIGGARSRMFVGGVFVWHVTRRCATSVMGKRTRRHDEGFQRRDDVVAASRRAHAFSEVGSLIPCAPDVIFFYLLYLNSFIFRICISFERILLLRKMKFEGNDQFLLL